MKPKCRWRRAQCRNCVFHPMPKCWDHAITIQECFKYCCLGSGYRDEPACCVPCKEFAIYALNFYRAVQCLGRGGCEWFTVHMHAFNTVCYILFMLVPFGPSITIESRGLLCDCPSAPQKCASQLLLYGRYWPFSSDNPASSLPSPGKTFGRLFALEASGGLCGP